MNPPEIYDAPATLAAKPYDPVECPFEFAATTDNNLGMIAKLRNGAFNKSDHPGGVLVNTKFHFAPTMTGMVAVTQDKAGFTLCWWPSRCISGCRLTSDKTPVSRTICFMQKVFDIHPIDHNSRLTSGGQERWYRILLLQLRACPQSMIAALDGRW